MWSYGLDTLWSGTLYRQVTGAGILHIHVCVGHFQLGRRKNRIGLKKHGHHFNLKECGVRITMDVTDILDIVRSRTVTETLSFQTVHNSNLSVPVPSLPEDGDWPSIWKFMGLIAWYTGQCPEYSNVYQIKKKNTTVNLKYHTKYLCLEFVCMTVYSFVNCHSTFWYIIYVLFCAIGSDTVSSV